MSLVSLVNPVAIERLTEPADAALVDELLREYLPWAGHKVFTLYDMPLDELPGQIESHRAAFLEKLPELLGRRGRLLLARLDGRPAGMAALEPLGQHTAEIKRMYTRPAARSRGIGRALMQRLIDDARAEGFRTARLQTLSFMPEAHALYRSLGFVEREAFDDARMDRPAPPGLIRYMELPLHAAD